MSGLGQYPAGAKHDRNAPYNDSHYDLYCDWCGNVDNFEFWDRDQDLIYFKCFYCKNIIFIKA